MLDYVHILVRSLLKFSVSQFIEKSEPQVAR